MDIRINLKKKIEKEKLDMSIHIAGIMFDLEVSTASSFAIS